MKEAFQQALNQHGYAFQHRVLFEIAETVESRDATWRLLLTEVPVSVQDRSTKVDFILKDFSNKPIGELLVGECKRVNPAFGTWCFSKTPYPTPRWISKQVCVESVIVTEFGEDASTGTGGTTSNRIYDLAFALKVGNKGDAHPVSNDKDAIESACRQVCTGLNGLVELLLGDQRYRKLLEGLHFMRILPVIFTTAELYTSEVNLREADLETGEIVLKEDLEKREWLFYQYPQSPDILHEIERGSVSWDSHGDLVARDFVRTVAIVSHSGVRSFLQGSEFGAPSEQMTVDFKQQLG